MKTVFITIPNTFFITGLGRSGTAFLASVLDRSRRYHVRHERYKEGRYRRKHKTFPIQRFIKHQIPFLNRFHGYGEVNSHLRHTIDPYKVGFEAMIEKRAIIVRNPRDLISSAMNRHNRTIEDFEDVCNRVLKEYARITTFKDHPSLRYEVFDFEMATSNIDCLQNIVEWAKIDDVKVNEETISKKVNTNKSVWFPKWSDWTDIQKEYYTKTYERIVTS